MMLTSSLKSIDLAALLCSRICHDLISPIGAIQNAMELYDEGGADEDALQLVRWSAANASVRLKFARLAFGFSGAVGHQIDTSSAEQIAQQYMKEEKASLKWQAPTLCLPKDEVKFLLNLLLVANATVSRGGEIVVTIVQNKNERVFRLEIRGDRLRVPSKFTELCNGKIQEEFIDASVVQFYYTLLLAEITGIAINVHESDGQVVLEGEKKL
ncbi:histidine phosphotransferase ChpT [Bartonella sp. CB178]|uniref:histidine phosphotransferase ChpT n=1 Tax=Bartonella sp. CB178 TaxID=3112255 RepID=UPI00300DDB68